MNPSDVPAQFLKGVGPRRAEQLARLGIRTVGELLYHLPARYLDRRQATPLDRLEAGATAVVQGTIARVRAVRTAYRRVRVVEASIVDAGVRATLVWF
ncbi:MAG TPA: DNA helicase RecG, partial [Planctomycetota bacterium]|nr:DNA helicase RecG [Planctomycetota bacterium]